MAAVDDKMAVCPLKHEVRIELWEKYIRAVVRTGQLKRYLTLYSPPLMDVKLFAEKGLIEFNADKKLYVGVVGATYDAKAYAAAQETLGGRLDLLLDVNINDLLDKPSKYPAKAKQLAEKFPFDAVNLDYTNSIFHESTKEDISEHLRALDALINRQNAADAKKFALMITTRSDLKFAEAFLADINARIDANIKTTPGFVEEFTRVFGCGNASDLAALARGKFLSIGLAKFVAAVLEDYGYRISSCDAHWLIRDAVKPVRELLHLAFLVERPPLPRALKKPTDAGRRKHHLESEIVRFVGKHFDGIASIKETSDFKLLNQKHGADIARLSALNFEVATPEPEPESDRPA